MFDNSDLIAYYNLSFLYARENLLTPLELDMMPYLDIKVFKQLHIHWNEENNK